ncbi:MAG: hypothetical protein C0459_06360 [Chitinophaga sp.]|jgi:5-oxoprolinase (ATP-hydrolysing) subunit A|nr:hypothetical protein [Chitinophaga sp.]
MNISANTSSIDINCDMGEGIGNDAAIMPFISSANIACGFHAGNATTIQQTIDLCLQHNVAIGAHPGFDDFENFGRTEMQLSTKEIYTLVSTQIIILYKACIDNKTTLHHVKPHGALYNMAAKNAAMAEAIAQAVKDVDSSLLFYGLANSYLISEAKKAGLSTANEVFADRTYQDDGSLTPRSFPNALIESDEQSLSQVLQMVHHKTVTSVNNKIIPLQAETICIHGDGKHAVSFAEKIYSTLKKTESSFRRFVPRNLIYKK